MTKGQVIRSRCMRWSSATAMPVNEWLLPTTFTRRPRSAAVRTSAAISSAPAGFSTSVAVAR
jgi:hypothetical protein